jgi:hypothetical protein
MKLKKSQLDKLQGFISKKQELSHTIGLIVLEEHRYVNLLGKLDNDYNDFMKVLKKEYGSTDIDLKTGQLKRIKED